MSSCRWDFTASGPRKNRTSRFPPGSEESQAIHVVLTRRTNAQTLVETSTEPTIVYVLTMVAGLEKEKMSGGRKFWRWFCGAEVFLKKRNMFVFIRISYDEFGVSGNTPPLTSRNVVVGLCRPASADSAAIRNAVSFSLSLPVKRFMFV